MHFVNIFMTEVAILYNQLIDLQSKKWTGFYMIRTSVMKELIVKAQFLNQRLSNVIFNLKKYRPIPFVDLIAF